MKTIEMIINETKTNEAMRQELAEAVKTNTVTEFLKNQGCEATVEEFVAAIKEQTEVMGEDELDATAGGIDIERIKEVLESISNMFTCDSYFYEPSDPDLPMRRPVIW